MPRPARTIAHRYRLVLRREETLPYGDDVVLARPAAAVRFLWEHVFEEEPREIMAVVFANSRHRATGHMVAFAGTLDRTAIEPRQILAAALLHNASSILIAHNHPSGDPSPSPEDHLFTERIDQAAQAVGIRLLDHLVLASATRWSSLRGGSWSNPVAVLAPRNPGLGPGPHRLESRLR